MVGLVAMSNFRSLAFVAATFAATAAMALDAPLAHAAGASGSAVYATGRDCGTRTATQSCTGPATHLIYGAFAGGPGQGVNAYDSNGKGDFVQSRISLGGGGLPLINQSNAALTNLRVNVNAFAYNSFTYTGAAPIKLSYAGALHVVGSSGSPTLGNSNFAGGAGYFSWVAIWDPSLVAGFTKAEDAFLPGASYGNYDCTTAGVYAFGYSTGALSGGEQSISMATESCGGGAFMIKPGQEILAVAFLQTPVNRGGWVDASHTFRMAYDPALPSDVRDTLIHTMTPGATSLSVPEPQTWALMIGGFGLAGVALRRRRMAMTT